MCQVYAVDDRMDESKLAEILGANLKKGCQYKSLEVRWEIKFLNYWFFNASLTREGREKVRKTSRPVSSEAVPPTKRVSINAFMKRIRVELEEGHTYQRKKANWSDHLVLDLNIMHVISPLWLG